MANGNGNGPHSRALDDKWPRTAGHVARVQLFLELNERVAGSSWRVLAEETLKSTQLHLLNDRLGRLEDKGANDNVLRKVFLLQADAQIIIHHQALVHRARPVLWECLFYLLLLLNKWQMCHLSPCCCWGDTYHLLFVVCFIEQDNQISLSAFDHFPKLMSIVFKGDLRYNVSVLLPIPLSTNDK